ncbi:hypothetical protein FO059_14450 [Tomitella fengzijianii]|uniref:N-acetyltransferase domain-containing protein n=1 Tax=Tomitella fengzijianii TaxID=2597660 RepID=A0A516X8J3_9ACTN|nr:hypothetical protein FO059_14450 [Tomitella fengzijianii]
MSAGPGYACDERPPRVSYRDADGGCTVVAATPSAEPGLWHEYLRGARDGYRRFGVEQALGLDGMRDGRSTAVFFVAVDADGAVVGGVRAVGPFRRVEDSHALEEWAGEPGLDEVRAMIAARLPGGVAEMKAAWAARGSGRVATTLARVAVHTMALLDVRFVMATSAAYVLDRWSSSGGVVADAVPATPYPDARYRTRIMWWDRADVLCNAERGQALKITEESAVVAAALAPAVQP